tara:strand:- start:14225 stop:14998 length:774 start_codon:yes stop_codon:yes gene_type:complete
MAAVFPPKVPARGLAALEQLLEAVFTGPLDRKKTTIYRGQTVKNIPNQRGGDFRNNFEGSGDKAKQLRKYSGKFWSQSDASAISHAKIVETDLGPSRSTTSGITGNVPRRVPVAVYKAEVKKTAVLRGFKAVLKHNQLASKATMAKPKTPLEKRVGMSDVKQKIRKGTLYQTIMDPPNKRLSIIRTAAVNPTFKGVRKAALKSGLLVGFKIASRFIAPVAAVDAIVNPTPAYNPRHGYKDKPSPRKRAKQTLKRIKK